MIGQIINYRYEILEKLGEGDLFVVYKARDKVLNRLVALKLLKDTFKNDPRLLAALKAGYAKASVLRYPGIAAVLDDDPTAEDFVVATEYIHGGNVKTYIRRGGAFGAMGAVETAIAILEALEYAHSVNIVHGDLRPQDIIVTPDGRIKITDFGISDALLKSPQVKQNCSMRSVYYQAPEVAAGGIASKLSDVYSVGVILYEMLTGVVPFSGDTAVSVALKQVGTSPLPPRDHNKSVPKSLSDLVLRAIEKDPQQRYPSAAEMLNDLRIIHAALKKGRPVMIQQPNVSAKSISIDEEEFYPEAPLKKPLIWLIILFVAVTVMTFFISLGMQNKKSEIIIPSVLGMTREEARAEANKLKIQFIDEGSMPSEDYEIGRICSLVPPAGTAVPRDGAKIQVKFSSGPDRRLVPDVVGMMRDDAERIAEDSDFVVEIKTRYDENVGKGIVISQSPVANTNVKPNINMVLFVSKGPRPAPSEDMDDSRSEVKMNVICASVPASAEEAQEVRIIVEDERGETEEYIRYHEPGEEIRQEVPTYGDDSKIKVYVGGNLQSETGGR